MPNIDLISNNAFQDDFLPLPPRLRSALRRISTFQSSDVTSKPSVTDNAAAPAELLSRATKLSKSDNGCQDSRRHAALAAVGIAADTPAACHVAPSAGTRKGSTANRSAARPASGVFRKTFRTIAGCGDVRRKSRRMVARECSAVVKISSCVVFLR